MRPFPKKALRSGLEIETGLVKFVQAQDCLITKLLIKQLSADTKEQAVIALKEIVAAVKGKVGDLTFCIPRHKVTVRFLRLPSIKEKEIAGMVKLQVAKQLPFPKEEMISDYFLSEQTQDGYSKVALVIVQKEVVEGYLEILQQAGLKPNRISFSTEAILSWYQQAFKQEQLESAAGLIDLDVDNNDLVILNNYSIDFTRGLTYGSSSLQSDPGFIKKLIEELRLTLEGYKRQEKTRQIERFLLSHVESVAEELKPLLEEEFDLPCELFMPLKEVNCRQEIFNTEYKSGLSLLRVLGLVFTDKRRKINLLPEQLRKKQISQRKKKEVIRFSLVILGIVLFSTAIFAKKLHDRQEYLNYLGQRIETIKPKATKLEQMLKRIALIQRRSQMEGSSIDVLRQLHMLTPSGISFSSLLYNEEQSSLTLEGLAGDLAQVFNLIGILEKSEYFKNVQLKYGSEKKTQTTEKVNFKIECNLEK